MSASWQNSVVLITSKDGNNSAYGTGFAVHRDVQGTYVLTCTHVVDDVGGKESVKVNNIPATVIALGPADGIDIAVLLVVGLADKPLLRPYVNSTMSEAFELAGYYHLDDNPKKRLVFRRFRGKFNDAIQTGMTLNTLVPVWEIEVTGKDELRPGNSGSPVVDENNYVIGVVNTRLNADKKRGWVTPIKGLEEIWQDMPPSLFVQRADGEMPEQTEKISRTKQAIRVFLSSPEDVQEYKQAAFSLIQVIAQEMLAQHQVALEVVAWDDPATGRPLRTDQLIARISVGSVPLPSDCDIVVLILWNRMGGPVEYQEQRYESITSFVYNISIEEAENRGLPRLLIYHCIAETFLNLSLLSGPEGRRRGEEMLRQYEHLQTFIDNLSYTDDIHQFRKFKAPIDFQQSLQRDMQALIADTLLARRTRGNDTPAIPSQNIVDLQAVEQRYLQWVISEHQHLTVSGAGTREHSYPNLEIDLEQVYIALKGDRSNSYERLQARALLDSEALELLLSNPRIIQQSGGHISLSELRAMIEDARQEVLLYSPIPFYLEERNRTSLFESTITLAEAFQQERWLVILGDPGSGKTTLVQWLALRLATALSKGEPSVEVKARLVNLEASAPDERENLGPARLPILFRVSDYVEYSKTHPEKPVPLIRFLAHHKWKSVPHEYDSLLQPDVLQQVFEKRLTDGEAVILLDGMDEITSRDVRDHVRIAVEEFINRWINGRGKAIPTSRIELREPPFLVGGNQIVITSRITGYSDVPIRSGVMQLTIERMTRPAIEYFCHSWVKAVFEQMAREENKQSDQHEVDVSQRAQKVASELIANIYQPNNSALRELASNPLLVTMLAKTFLYDRTFPQQRVELYRKALNNLIFDWTRANDRKSGTEGLPVTEEEMYYILPPLADHMHRHYSNGRMPTKEMIAELKKSLVKYRSGGTTDHLSLQSIDTDIQRLLSVIRDDAGLLAERGKDEYAFIHLTFQEYLAAIYLIHPDYHDYQTTVELLLHRMANPRWAEIVRLALGHISVAWSEDARDTLLERLLKQEEEVAMERLVPRSLLLLAQATPDMRTLPEHIVKRLTKQLLDHYADIAIHHSTPELAKLIASAMHTVHTIYPASVNRVLEQALLYPEKKRPHIRSAAALLIRLHRWYPLVLTNALQEALPHDSALLGFPIDRALQNIITPSLVASIPDPSPPGSVLLSLREQLRRIETGEEVKTVQKQLYAISLQLIEEYKRILNDIHIQGDSEKLRSQNGDEDTQLLEEETYIKRKIQEIKQFTARRERLSDLPTGKRLPLFDASFARLQSKHLGDLEKAAVELEKELLAIGEEAKQILEKIQKEQENIIGQIVLYFHRLREQKRSEQELARLDHDQEAQRAFPSFRLRLRKKLKEDSDTLQYIRQNIPWTRLIIALYGGMYNYERHETKQEYYQIVAYLDMSDRDRKAFTEIYKTKFGDIDTVLSMATYLDEGMEGQKLKWGMNTTVEFHIDALYREPEPLITTLIEDVLTRRQPAHELKEALWKIWDHGIKIEARADALTALGVIGEPVIPVLRAALADTTKASAAQLAIAQFARIQNSLHDPVAGLPDLPRLIDLNALQSVPNRAHNEIVESLSAATAVLVKMGAPPVDWTDNIQKRKNNQLAGYLLAETLACYTSVLYHDIGKEIKQALNNLQKEFEQDLDKSDTWQTSVTDFIFSLSSLQHARNLQSPLHQGWMIEHFPLAMLGANDLPWHLFTALETIPNQIGFMKSWALRRLQPYLNEHPEWIPEALAFNLGDSSRHADTYQTALLLDPSLKNNVTYLEAIRERAERLRSPYHRARALLRLVRYFPEQYESMLDAIQQDIYAIEDPNKAVCVAQYVLPFLPFKQRERLLNETLTMIQHILDPSNRALALVRMVFHVIPDGRQSLLKETLESIALIEDEHVQARCLGMLRPLLLLYHLEEQAQRISERFTSRRLQALALGELAPLVHHCQTLLAEKSPPHPLLYRLFQSDTRSVAWATLGLAALTLDVQHCFDSAADLDCAWIRLNTVESASALEVLLDQASRGGITVTCAGALVIDDIWIHGNREILREILPFLHQPAPDTVPLLEKWLLDDDTLLSSVAALLLADVQGLSSRNILRIVQLLESDNNRLRNRASYILHTFNSKDGSNIRASQIGYEIISTLKQKKQEAHDENNSSVGLMLQWIIENIVYDDPLMIDRWISVLSQNQLSQPEAKLAYAVLSDIQRIDSSMWPALIAGLKHHSTQVQMALLRSLCLIAYGTKNNEGENNTLASQWETIKPIVQNVAHNAIAQDEQWMIIAAVPEHLWEPIQVGLQCLQTQGEDYQAAIHKGIEQLQKNAINVYARLSEQPDLWFMQEIGSYNFWGEPQENDVVQMAKALREEEKSLRLVIERLTYELNKDIHDSKGDDRRMLLLSLAAELASLLPTSNANNTNSDYLETLLVQAVLAHNRYPGRKAAMKLLSFLRKTTRRTGEALRAALRDVQEVRQEALRATSRFRSIDSAILLDIFQGLTDSDCMVAYATVQLLEALGRNDKIEEKDRQKILEALADAAQKPSAQRLVEPAYTPNKIPAMPILRDRMYDAMIQIMGLK